MIGFFKRVRVSALAVAAFLAILGWLLARFMGPDYRLNFSQARELAQAHWVVIFAGVAVGYVLMRVRTLIAAFAGLSFIAVVIFASHAAAPQKGIASVWIILFIQIGIALVCSVVFNVIRVQRENRRLARALENYFAPDTAKKFTALRYRKLFDAGTERRKLTLLFTAPQGSTSNDSTALLASSVHATGGAIVTTTSGTTFAFWNAPELQKDHANRACKTALRARKRAKLGIGLHTGTAAVGNFGTATEINYTAAGDNLELTVRIAALNKILGTEVLVSAETKREMSDQFVTRYVGNFRFKDFDDYIGIYELMGNEDVDEMERALRDSFEQAVYAFQGCDAQEAESAFRRVLDIYPDDKPAQFYLRRIESLSGQPWPYDWSGTVEIDEV